MLVRPDNRQRRQVDTRSRDVRGEEDITVRCDPGGEVTGMLRFKDQIYRQAHIGRLGVSNELGQAAPQGLVAPARVCSISGVLIGGIA